ncbi:polysaccharide biosynthesis tyrosine autokinase [Agromyces aerolatus]|uniref:polysaccharide biosynthesis tyrosine autokinase n=1 Tax=Agromyces sp. LY-1074 TaxID=3074080 RepID=UPI00285D193A|nr:MULTISPECIES: polysaccharide biosynthesis tyrosine autokinase [unclassified Agromyces]MDR5701472.1 polysaccharide biosynthesis tyrosine autokinase [Agromyces sp. LY-1074]MDR5704461.1 polysaccharide biosynthesis tyrosine autokinase [Agromyces sp. LY-1358]
MELRDYVRVLRQHWVLIVALTLLGVAAAAGYSIMQTPQYSSSAKVFVSTSGGASVSELQQGNTFTQQRVKTYADLVTTPIVLLPVINELSLDTTGEALARQISASAPLDTTLIQITATDDDPALAAALATAVSQSLTQVVGSIESTNAAAQAEGEETDASPAQSPVRLTLVQHAAVPQSPVSPNVPLNIALGALVGLALGVGIAVLRATLDTRIRNERDVEMVTETPIIGGIVFDPKAKERPLIVHADPHSPRAESFRTLRTNLQFLEPGRGDRAFVVTSSIESEGKSTTAANLAIALADSGARVLLVDADLRRPKVASYLGIEGAVGLTDLLIGRADLADVIQRWGRNQLYVLPAGRIPPNPSELLGSTQMVKVIQELQETFDVVLFDAPPLLPVTDAAVLARSVGGAIVVVAAGRAHKQHLRGALAALENVDAPVSGVVLTMLPTKGPDAYGYGRYGYGYGYGYAAQPDEEAVRT